jgi:hypothetical protein
MTMIIFGMETGEQQPIFCNIQLFLGMPQLRNGGFHFISFHFISFHFMQQWSLWLIKRSCVVATSSSTLPCVLGCYSFEHSRSRAQSFHLDVESAALLEHHDWLTRTDKEHHHYTFDERFAARSSSVARIKLWDDRSSDDSVVVVTSIQLSARSNLSWRGRRRTKATLS